MSVVSLAAPRVVITGIGMVTGLGADHEATWTALTAGEGAVRWLDPAELFPPAGLPVPAGDSPRFAGAPALPCSLKWGGTGFASAEVIQGREKDTGRASATHHRAAWEEPTIALALRAAEEAVADANFDFDRVPPFRRGCVIGTSKGGLRSFSRAMIAQEQNNGSESLAELWRAFLPNTPALRVAGRWNVAGPVLCPVAACATGLMSLNRGAELIREGTCDVVLAGSTDASLQPAVLGAFQRMGVLARGFEDPAAACRPFDLHRNGFVVGEGAAVLVMEREDGVRSRGVVPYAEWLAGGCVSDPTGIAQLDPDASAMTWLIRDVLKRSNVRPHEVDYVNLHGTGTWDNDRTETRALRTALGEAAETISCSSLKGALGHLLGAAGSVETACTLLAIRDETIPPTRNLTRPDPECNLDYVPQTSRHRPIRRALKLSLGFGGHQVAALFGRIGES